MDEYIYLIWVLSLLAVWLAIIIIRKDLKHRIIKASILGGIMGIFAEFWYFKDYWQPPTVMGQGFTILEDFLFGFCITGIAVSIYDIIRGYTNGPGAKPHKLLFGLLFILSIGSLLVLNTWIGIYSIIVSIVTFLICSIIIVSIRKDLLKPALVSGILMVLVTLPIYIFLFDVLSPNYWHLYWLLNQTKLNLFVFGNIPLTELIWCFSWGCFCGGGYSFYSGTKKIVSHRK